MAFTTQRRTQRLSVQYSAAQAEALGLLVAADPRAAP